MKRTLVLFTITFLACFVVNAQQASTPDYGSINDGIYNNKFFGFSVTYPKNWAVHGEETNARLREIGKERATSSGALSAATTDVILKNTYQLLTTFQYPVGTPDVEVNAGFMLVAEKVSHAPAIVNGRDYLAAVKPLMIKTGVEIIGEPTELELSGRTFFRQNSRMPVQGMPVHQATILTVAKGYVLAFILTGKDQQTIDELAKAVGTIKFAPLSP